MLKICNKVKDENKITIEKENISINEVKKIDESKNIKEKTPEVKDTDEVNIVEEVASGTMESIIQEDEIIKNSLEKKNLNRNIEVSFDDILNILVQADRRILNEIKEKWPVIARYRFNLNTAKFASMLCDGNPVAAAPGGIIIAFEHQPNVNEINETENYYQLKNFLLEVLGQDYDFIAVKSSVWPDIRNKYIEMNRAKSLPEAQPIILHHIGTFHDSKKKLNKAQSLAIELFGDIVEFEE